MHDLFQQFAAAGGEEGSAAVLVARLLVAAVYGAAVAGTRTLTRPDAKPAPGFRTTLVLLTVLTCLVMLVIGNNLSRAFGLAGVLAVVRFRTVVDDTRDSAFVIFAMAVGLAVGYGYLVTAAVSLPVIAFVGLVARGMGLVGPFAGPLCEAAVDVRVKAGSGAEAGVAATLKSFGTYVRLTAAGTNKDGDLDLTYHLRPRPAADPVALVAKLKAAAGVEKAGYAVVMK